MIQTVALVASILLPLCNIPLIVKIVRRKSSQDVSLEWAVGVWICLLMMAPAGLISPDLVWKTYTIVNFVLFSGVMVIVLIYRKGKAS